MVLEITTDLVPSHKGYLIMTGFTASFHNPLVFIIMGEPTKGHVCVKVSTILKPTNNLLGQSEIVSKNIFLWHSILSVKHIAIFCVFIRILQDLETNLCNMPSQTDKKDSKYLLK